MNITFEQLVLTDFKNHKSLQINFSDITTISGQNGAGKSTIGESITWILYGVDPLGTKLEPTPIGSNDETITRAELLLKVDDKQILLGRSLNDGKAKYYINEVPSKATEYNNLVESLFDKNLFLSLFNPNYFFTQHWEKQRAQLLQYVSEPTNVEVLGQLNTVQQNNLTENLKKNTLGDLEKIHRENNNSTEKEFIRATERVKTLKEQLAEIELPDNADKLKQQLEALQKQYEPLKEQQKQSAEIERKRSGLSSKLESLKSQINREKKSLNDLKTQPIQDTCFTCGQALTDEAVEKVKATRKEQMQKVAAEGKRLVEVYKKIEQELPTLPDPLGDNNEIEDLYSKIANLKAQLDKFNEIDVLKNKIKQAESDAESIRKSKNNSQAIIESIKEFKSKQAEIMAEKVDSLFNTISIRLYNEQKNGELKQTFEIEMDNKPYSKLSTAEKIKAGLELIEVLIKQSGVIAPTFVDNAESILNFTKPSGQLIISRVLDIDFEINTEDLKGDVVSE